MGIHLFFELIPKIDFELNENLIFLKLLSFAYDEKLLRLHNKHNLNCLNFKK